MFSAWIRIVSLGSAFIGVVCGGKNHSDRAFLVGNRIFRPSMPHPHFLKSPSPPGNPVVFAFSRRTHRPKRCVFARIFSGWSWWDPTKAPPFNHRRHRDSGVTCRDHGACLISLPRDLRTSGRSDRGVLTPVVLSRISGQKSIISGPNRFIVDIRFWRSLLRIHPKPRSIESSRSDLGQSRAVLTRRVSERGHARRLTSPVRLAFWRTGDMSRPVSNPHSLRVGNPLITRDHPCFQRVADSRSWNSWWCSPSLPF